MYIFFQISRTDTIKNYARAAARPQEQMKNLSGKEKATLCSCAVICLAMVLAIDIAAIVIGFEYQNFTPCGTFKDYNVNVNLTIPEVLVIGGFVQIAVCLCSFTMVLLGTPTFCACWGNLFIAIWAIIGLVIFYDDKYQNLTFKDGDTTKYCKDHSLAIMLQVWCWFKIIVGCCGCLSGGGGTMV